MLDNMIEVVEFYGGFRKFKYLKIESGKNIIFLISLPQTLSYKNIKKLESEDPSVPRCSANLDSTKKNPKGNLKDHM